MWLKGWMPYEESYRVPLIVRWPGHIAPASRSARLVQTHDLDASRFFDHGLHHRPRRFDEMRSHLFEQVPPLLAR